MATNRTQQQDQNLTITKGNTISIIMGLFAHQHNIVTTPENTQLIYQAVKQDSQTAKLANQLTTNTTTELNDVIDNMRATISAADESNPTSTQEYGFISRQKKISDQMQSLQTLKEDLEKKFYDLKNSQSNIIKLLKEKNTSTTIYKEIENLNTQYQNIKLGMNRHTQDSEKLKEEASKLHREAWNAVSNKTGLKAPIPLTPSNIQNP